MESILFAFLSLFLFSLQNEYNLSKLMSYYGWNKSQIEQKWQLVVIYYDNSNWFHEGLCWGFWGDTQGLPYKECAIN